jgi:restriction endonuclease S subunit
MKGTAGQLRVPVDYLRNVQIPVPPLLEQRHIVMRIEGLFLMLSRSLMALEQARMLNQHFTESTLRFCLKKESIRGHMREHGGMEETDHVQQAKIRDICRLVNGRAFKPSEWSKDGIPIVRIQNLNDPSAPYNHCNFVIDDKFIIDNGDLLFAWSGTPGTSFGAHIWRGTRACLNQHIFKLIVDPNQVDKKYLMHALNNNLREYIGQSHGGAGLAHITKPRFEESSVLLPPLGIQRIISEELDSLLSEGNQMKTALDRARRQQDLLGASILVSAMTGRFVMPSSVDETDEMCVNEMERKKTSSIVSKEVSSRTK